MAPGFEDFEGGDVTVGGGVDVGGVVVVVAGLSTALLLLLLSERMLCWLVSPLSSAAPMSAGPSAALPEQQLPMERNGGSKTKRVSKSFVQRERERRCVCGREIYKEEFWEGW